MNKLMTRLLTAALVTGALLTGAVTSASAQDKDEQRNVALLLMAYDQFPTAEAFKQVSANPRAVILSIYRDPASKPIVRLQALDALSLFPNEEVRELYKGILAKGWADEAPGEAHRAINGLMHGFGTDALADVAPMLNDKDIQIRMTAIEAIFNSGKEEGQRLLKARLDKENHPVVRDLLVKRTLSVQ